jgi:putative membrane protein
MHPFYGPSARLVGEGRTTVAGLVSMAAYLAFWAGVVVMAKRELDARLPRYAQPARQGDDALAVLRARYARGEIDREAFLQVQADLAAGQEEC